MNKVKIILPQTDEEKWKAKQLPKEEPERQTFRKKFTEVSRFLGNHYNPKIHKRAFWPNGLYLIKKNYHYNSDIGLCYFYERNNVLDRLEVRTKEKKAKPVSRFIEFDYLEENEVVLTIEHCSNCDDHQTHQSHTGEFYTNLAKALQKSILLRFPFIKVLLKPIDTNIVMQNEATIKMLSSTKVIDQKYKDVKIGAFEVQMVIGKKESKHNTPILLHSKLTTKQWPNIKNILEKIVGNLHQVNLEIQCYDKERESESQVKEQKSQRSESKEPQQTLLSFSRFEKINVKLYRLRIPEINELSKATAEDLQYLCDPKKRTLLLMNTKANVMQETPFQHHSTQVSTSEYFLPGSRPTSGKSISISRPTTPSSQTQLKFVRPQSTRGNQRMNFSNCSAKTSQFAQNKKKLNSSFIEDTTIIESLKGKLMGTTQINENGLINITGIPYDSYLVEIEESKNFLQCASIIKFNSIPENNYHKKFVGLVPQVNATPEILVYYTKPTPPDAADDFNGETMLSGADVYLKRCIDNLGESTFDESKLKFKLKEKKSNAGCYEDSLVPGRYLLDVRKQGFEAFIGEVELVSGENRVNVELFPIKPSRMQVIVYNYETMSPLENVQLKFCHSTTEDTIEGLSDNLGEYTIETLNNDDFITVYANKVGYMAAQRTFVKDRNDQDYKGEPKKIKIVLVREVLFHEEKSILLFTYSNLLGDNFTPIVSSSENITSLMDIVISDYQVDHGILVTYIRIKQDEYEFKEFEEILRIILKVNNPELRKQFEINYNTTFNGLQKYSCESILYTSNNTFYLQPPQFSRENHFEYIDVGFLDINNIIFYELGLLLKDHYFEKNLFFEQWIAFLQILIDKKLYSKLFEAFGFQKGVFYKADRLLADDNINNLFQKTLKTYNLDDSLSCDFMIYLCDLMKTNNNMISYSIFKKKVSSNLKNFKEIKFFNASDKLGSSTISKFK